MEEKVVNQQEEETRIQGDVIIVGGGLAGLSAAATLAKKGKKVVVLERATLGGRAVTINMKGFAFNFGAHAIYGRDSSYLRRLEKELDIQIDWRDFNPDKAKYGIGEGLTDVPVNVKGLFKTKLLKASDKVKFTYEILKTMTKVEKGDPHISISKWMEDKEVNEEVREMMLTLASSNFFTRQSEQIPSDVFFKYYSRLFTTQKPVAYIGGGWQALIQELERVILENDGMILQKTKAESVLTEDARITGVQTSKGVVMGEEFVFCIPPTDLVKVFEETKITDSLKQYASYSPSYVYVYDIGLKNRVDVPYSYIYDKQSKIFITDISYYDETCTPPGGQLLQAIAYLNEEDLKNKDVLDEYHAKIEALYDQHFSGWREELVIPRVSKRAIAQQLKWVMTQQALPVFLPDYRNLFFAGDWCEGQGQLSELSFSSAYQASQHILQKHK
ncbi:phytoene desaturase family protein [Bacillus horti]|uniref:Phytoene dehydrogenase-like protein n=1 Tax=Caldalkalibacillus horti TaxID=77523 RepID=A0ABT9VTB0_9BACI|nr:FAD-dependent oxidoreductase [Bacillus horti]MDQ0164204.1 phytoene dehydrogenase-like protein [Bacillus horti]